MDSTNFLSSLTFSISVTLPTLLMLILGIAMRKRKMVDDKFCEQATKMVFNITLPIMLFFSVFGREVNYREQINLLLIGVFGTLALFLLAEIFAARFIAEKRERGTFVQAVYRGNNGILGLAFCINAYGDAAFAPASIYSAALIFVYNILAVITLTRSLSTGKIRFSGICKSILKNPLIIGITLALVANGISLEIPKPLLSAGHYLAGMTLPLALICTGATIDLAGFRQTSQVSLWGSTGRLIVAPVFMVGMAKITGMDGINMGIVLLMSSTPLAAATYAMVRGMGGNATTAANIIGITTIVSMFTSSLGLLILSQLGWL